MKMLIMRIKFIFSIYFILTLISCQSDNSCRIQVENDLKGILNNKIDISNLQIKNSKEFQEDAVKYDSIFFDCDIYFTDALRNEDLDFQFEKGMKIESKNNVFVYEKSFRTRQLVKLKFGETRILSK